MERNPISAEIQERFMALSCRLSPETLSCDGERSRADQRRVYAEIMREWRSLEAKVGRKVTEAEVWAVDMAGRAADAAG